MSKRSREETDIIEDDHSNKRGTTHTPQENVDPIWNICAHVITRLSMERATMLSHFNRELAYSNSLGQSRTCFDIEFDLFKNGRLSREKNIIDNGRRWPEVIMRIRIVLTQYFTEAFPHMSSNVQYSVEKSDDETCAFVIWMSASS